MFSKKLFRKESLTFTTSTKAKNSSTDRNYCIHDTTLMTYERRNDTRFDEYNINQN